MLRPDGDHRNALRNFGALVFARKLRERARIAVINGHPDPRPERFCAALAGAYAQGARSAGLEVRELVTGAGDISPESAFQALDWANHFVVVFPMWLDRPPAPLQAFFAGWARHVVEGGYIEPPARTARLVVTMGMPAFAHRRQSEAISLPGIYRADISYIGSVESASPKQRAAHLADAWRTGARTA